MNIDTIKEDLSRLYEKKPHRLQHVFGVCETAKKLGKMHQVDLEKLEIAALLHDITKYYTTEENIKMIQKYYANSEEILEEFNIHILHAFSARVVAREKYHVTDSDILDAIENHTIGRANMSIYEKIIFISDYIEPNRTYESCVKTREIAFDNLDLAVYTAINDSIIFYEKNGGQVPKSAYLAREYYYDILGGNV